MSPGAGGLRAAWWAVDPPLRRFLLANLVGLWGAIAALGLVYLTVAPYPPVLVDLTVMLAAGLVLLGGTVAIVRWGAGGAVATVLASTTVFAFGATWVTPFLAPLTCLVLLVPVMVAYPYLSRRAMVAVVVTASASISLLAGMSQWRRLHVDPPHPVIGVASLLVFTPFVVVVIAYSLTQTYRRMEEQAGELAASRHRIAQVAISARRGLERDLHDGAQQRLVGMSVQISRAASLVEAGRSQDALEALDGLAEQNLAAVAELRELARGIYPPLLEERGLVAALNAAARRSPVPCSVVAEPVARQGRAVEAAIYFCILEALQNVAKHAGAQEVQVGLRAEPRLEFRVVDDGHGFDPAAAGGEGGLLGMEARIRAEGGELSVRSVPGAGTTVQGVFPWPGTAGPPQA